MVVSNYLDFYDLFVNRLIGTPVLFMILLAGIIVFVAAKARIQNDVIWFLLIAFTFLMSITIGDFLPFVVVVGMAFVGWVYAKFMNR